MWEVPVFWVGLALLQVVPACSFEVLDVVLLPPLEPNKPFIDPQSDANFCDTGRPLKFVKFVLPAVILTVALELTVDSVKTLTS